MSSNIRVNSITPAVGNNVAIGTAGGTITFNCDTISGIATFANDIDITQTLDVDGHTELDNVNISGVVTATSFVGPVTGNITGNADTASNLTGSPSITVTDITASGNVSIAGTLTYEDVTNIDSVGVVTARSGIHVTGGNVGIGTDNPQGKLVVSNGSAGLEFNPNSNQAIVSYNRVTSTYTPIGLQGSYQSFGIGGLGEVVRITGIGSVGISSTAPKTDVDISQKTGAVALPQGTTAQRPTGSAPYIRKNTTNNALEYYDGTSWVEIITDYFPTGSVILG